MNDKQKIAFGLLNDLATDGWVTMWCVDILICPERYNMETLGWRLWREAKKASKIYRFDLSDKEQIEVLWSFLDNKIKTYYSSERSD